MPPIIEVKDLTKGFRTFRRRDFLASVVASSLLPSLAASQDNTPSNASAG